VGIVSAVNMPATLNEIADASRQALAAGQPVTEDELVSALQQQGIDLGANPGETVAEVLEGDDVGVVLPLGDGRHALLPALLMGRTFTHRVSYAEIAHGFLNVSPDLDPVSILTDDDTYQRLVDGTELIEVLSGFDADLLIERGIPVDAIGDAAWLLEPGVVSRLDVGVGDLVGVTVRRTRSTAWCGWPALRTRTCSPLHCFPSRRCSPPLAWCRTAIGLARPGSTSPAGGSAGEWSTSPMCTDWMRMAHWRCWCWLDCTSRSRV